MSDPVIRRVRRSIDEAKNRGGMQAGMPKVTIDASDAARLCLLAEHLLTGESLHQQPEQGDDDGGEYAAYLEGMNSHLKAENEALREGMRKVNATAERHEREMYLAKDEAEALRARVKELEWDSAHQRERRNAARDCVQKMKAESFRKQAEAVELAARGAVENAVLSDSAWGHGWIDGRETAEQADRQAQRLRQQADEIEKGASE